MELAAPNSHPCRSVRLRSKAARVGNLPQTIRGMSSVSLSDGDIDNCNSRLRDTISPADPSKLWEISRRVGIFCKGDDQEVENEYVCMEARDVEFLKNVEERNKDGLL